MKVLPVADDELLRRFAREQRAIGRLSQTPGIVPVYESGQTDRGEPYLVMPYMEKGSLQQHIDEHGPMGWRDAVSICAEVADALAKAHEAGVLHRDVKPGNILVSAEGRPLVADFGVASVAGTTGVTTDGVRITPAFTAPEALRGLQSSPTVDAYGLGATLYTLVTGEAPFVGSVPSSDIPALLDAIRSEPVVIESDLEVPDDFRVMVEALMSKDPSDRPSDLSEIAGRLRGLLPAGSDADHPHEAFITTLDTRPPSKRLRRAVMAVMSAPVLLLGVLVFVLLRAGSDSSEGRVELRATALYEGQPEAILSPTFSASTGVVVVAHSELGAGGVDRVAGLTAVNASTGTIRWTLRMDQVSGRFDSGEVEVTSGGQGWVAVAEAPSPNGNFGADGQIALAVLDSRSKTPLWASTLSEIAGSLPPAVADEVEEVDLVFAGDVLLVQLDGHTTGSNPAGRMKLEDYYSRKPQVVALDAESGTILWSTSGWIDWNTHDTVVVFPDLGELDIAGSGVVRGVDPRSGAELWGEPATFNLGLWPMSGAFVPPLAEPASDALVVEEPSLRVRDLLSVQTIATLTPSADDPTPHPGARARRLDGDTLLFAADRDEGDAGLISGIGAYQFRESRVRWFRAMCDTMLSQDHRLKERDRRVIPEGLDPGLVEASTGEDADEPVECDFEFEVVNAGVLVAQMGRLEVLGSNTGEPRGSSDLDGQVRALVGVDPDGEFAVVASARSDQTIRISRIDVTS